MRTDPSARAFLRSSPSQFLLPHLAVVCPHSPRASDPWPPGPVLPCSGLPTAAGSCLPEGPRPTAAAPLSWEAPPFMILGSWGETVSERLRRDPILPVLCPPPPLHPRPPPPAPASLCKAEAWKFPST